MTAAMLAYARMLPLEVRPLAKTMSATLDDLPAPTLTVPHKQVAVGDPDIELVCWADRHAIAIGEIAPLEQM